MNVKPHGSQALRGVAARPPPRTQAQRPNALTKAPRPVSGGHGLASARGTGLGEGRQIGWIHDSRLRGLARGAADWPLRLVAGFVDVAAAGCFR